MEAKEWMMMMKMQLIEQTSLDFENSEGAQLSYCILYQNPDLPLDCWHEEDDGDGSDGDDDDDPDLLTPLSSLASQHIR